METVVQHSSELCIPKHLSCHNDLAPFSDLMKWLKEVDQTVFLELCQVLIRCSYLQINPVHSRPDFHRVASVEGTTNRTCTQTQKNSWASVGVISSSVQLHIKLR